METRGKDTYDVVGIGFGPSNLSLAVALEEQQADDPENLITTTFFERQPSFGWHRNMLLPAAKMQISFLKDLVTFRNPVSRFSFISYLHQMDRLARFVNNQDFFPTRREFHDYLEWVESRLSNRVTYGTEVTAIRLPPQAGQGPVESVQVEVRNDTYPDGTRLINARNLVISTGLLPRMPASIERDERVWHSSEFLEKFHQLDRGELRRVAVVGAGQSAAEIVRFLYDELPGATIFAIIPSYGYSIADNTPYANQVFDASAVDEYYYGTEQSKDAFWRYHRNTNYSVVEPEVIWDLYRRAYDEEVSRKKRLHLVKLTMIDAVKRAADETRITVNSLLADESYDVDVDVLVCATGYDPMQPTDLLHDLDGLLVRDGQGRYQIERDYSLITMPDLCCGIYLQGGTERTHGLSSSLLSNIAVRSGEIANSIAVRLARERLRVSKWAE